MTPTSDPGAAARDPRRQNRVGQLFRRLLAEKGRVHPHELNALLADAGEPAATREEMDRAAGLAADPEGRAEQAEALRDLVRRAEVLGLKDDDLAALALPTRGSA